MHLIVNGVLGMRYFFLLVDELCFRWSGFIMCSFFFSSRRRHTRCLSDWSSDVCSSDLEFLSIIGPSGCGKSTLFNIIGGLLDGYQGSVKVAGDLVRGPHPSIGMIFQEESKIGRASCRERV